MVSLRVAAVCLAALVAAPAAAAQAARTPPGPTSLKGFMLRASEPAKTTFSRTPSFAWTPVRGAVRYEFQLATSQRFNDGSLVWSNLDPSTELAPDASQIGATAPATPAAPSPSSPTATAEALRNLRSPAVALDVALPWITGEPFALYARVRAVLKNGATRWSKPYGFNVRWQDVARPLPTAPGLIRWSSVDGATAYEVWIFGAAKTFTTTTNVADQRDIYTFRPWTSTVSWRVRALRSVFGDIPSGLPAALAGPWSPVYTTVNPPLSLGQPLSLSSALSDVQSLGAKTKAHTLTPGFSWSGSVGTASGFSGAAELFRVYVATDRDCVNLVYRSAIVGGAGYAPRGTGALQLPHDASALTAARNGVPIPHGAEGEALMLDGAPAVTSEASPILSGGSGGASGGSSGGSSGLAKVDLWDNSWAAGGYYWTVVPVIMEATSETSFRYRELELPQDACQSGRLMRFAKASAPVVTSNGTPFASGLSTTGRLLSAARAKDSFYGSPLVAWAPAVGAHEYEVQWSRTAYPWRRVGSTTTSATAMVLPLTPGTWYYRVRGLNHSLPRLPQMGWSKPVRLKVAKPVYSVVR